MGGSEEVIKCEARHPSNKIYSNLECKSLKDGANISDTYIIIYTRYTT
jgi:hypothetical protein